MPANTKYCSYCLRDKEEISKSLPISRRVEREKKKWIPWGLAGVFVLFMVWLLDFFLHIVDDLLKGRW